MGIYLWLLLFLSFFYINIYLYKKNNGVNFYPTRVCGIKNHMIGDWLIYEQLVTTFETEYDYAIIVEINLYTNYLIFIGYLGFIKSDTKRFINIYFYFFFHLH